MKLLETYTLYEDDFRVLLASNAIFNFDVSSDGILGYAHVFTDNSGTYLEDYFNKQVATKTYVRYTR